MIGAVVAATLALAVSPVMPSFCDIVTSAQRFERSYHELTAGSRLDPLQRIMVSLFLSNRNASTQPHS